jgi:hypothetical protein
MSHFTKAQLKLKNKDTLAKALVRMGVAESAITLSDTPFTIKDYYGHNHPHPVSLAVKKNAIRTSADVGFEEREDGSLTMHYDNMDHNRLHGEWMQKVTQHYAAIEVEDEAVRMGFSVKEQAFDQQGNLQIVLSRWG